MAGGGGGDEGEGVALGGGGLINHNNGQIKKINRQFRMKNMNTDDKTS